MSRTWGTVAVATAALTALLAVPATAGAAQPAGSGSPARPVPMTYRSPAGPVEADGRSGTQAAAGRTAAVPLRTFRGSFTSGGTSYPYTMVGTAPTGPAVTTTVANTLTPLAVTIGTSTLRVPATTLTRVTGSGLFTDQVFPGGTGQYGDVFMRTQFWSALANGTKDWHVRLAAPTVRPELRLTVPAARGRVETIAGVVTGFVDVAYVEAQLRAYAKPVDPAVLTQVLSNNVVLCTGTPLADLTNCGIGGFNGVVATTTGRHTFTYAAYLNRLIFNDPTFANTAVITHQVAQWLTDPFLVNRTPNWRSAIAPQYGCQNVLESAAPVVGRGVTLGGLFYQDAVYLNWFARQATSDAWQGRRTWFNSITALSPACTLP